MTLRHDSLPIVESGAHRVNAEADAWQEQHPPLVAVALHATADRLMLGLASAVQYRDGILAMPPAGVGGN